MNPQLQHLLFERLTADANIDAGAADLILCACEGREALATALTDGASAADSQAAQPRPKAIEPPGAYLASIAVTGFRGIGEGAELGLRVGPGLTLIVGRNGSGKSSFAEGLELLMTSENRRWTGRTKIWTEGWRNLHHPTQTSIAAALQVDGTPGLLRLRSGWDDEAALADTELEVVTADGQRTSLEALGWDVALARYRPFLSYNELGSMFDEPKTMYDALSAILGLDEIEQVGKDIREERLERERAIKTMREDVKLLLERLHGVDDERAMAASAALSKRVPDLDAIELALAGAIEGRDPESDLAGLRSLATLTTPAAEEVDAVLAALDEAEGRLEQLAGTDAARADGLAGLLEAALDHDATHPVVDCPVCGAAGVIDDDWREHATLAVRKLREEAEAVASASRAAVNARTRATELLAVTPPVTLARAEALGLDDSRLRDAWDAWQQARVEIVTDVARPVLAAVHEAACELAASATHELERREDLWRPVATELNRWLPGAGDNLTASQHLPTLKIAETWVKEAAEELRAERLAPIAERAIANWERLRQNSNVTLEAFALRRTGNIRAAAVDVRVDGTDASAIGVMSQGELHALAVSIFLPRAALAESPFRFMVIDDPVQSMDPAKVDGLARVLAETAAERQVVVFTHDERLTEAVRRLGLDATILEVTRRPGSRVEVRPGLDPVERYVADARALVRTENLPAEVARRVVPGFCRHALEAACVVAVRRRRLRRGDPHAAVEAGLREATTLMLNLALALFDDVSKGSQVLTAVNNRFGSQYGDVVVGANKGVHDLLAGDLRDFVRDTAVLARGLQELK